MKFYQLVKCKKDLSDFPEWSWSNGMVMRSENLDPEILVRYDSYDDAKAALPRHPCSAVYLGGPGRVARCVEYWIEVLEGDPDGDPRDWELLEEYAGEYPYIKIYDEKETIARGSACGFFALVPDLQAAHKFSAAHQSPRENRFIFVDMDNEKTEI